MMSFGTAIAVLFVKPSSLTTKSPDPTPKEDMRMRSFIPSFLATICAVAVLAGPAQAQRGWRGGYGGSYNGYYGNYYGYNGNYGYYHPYYGYYGGYYTPYYSYYGGYSYPQYSYGYGYGYGYPQYYSTTPYPSNTYANNTPSQQTTSSYGDPYSGVQSWFRVILPDPMARLTIQNQSMQSTGTERAFYTPTLERGKTYTYTLRAAWMENGAEVTREKKVDVVAGQNIIVNFADTNAETGEPIPVAPATTTTALIGEVVRVDGDHVIFVESKGGRERSFRLAPNGRLTIGGTTADFWALKPGMKVTVTAQPNSTSMATVIEAVPHR
jgi:uncharacterized protein (TIGR03000 family)